MAGSNARQRDHRQTARWIFPERRLHGAAHAHRFDVHRPGSACRSESRPGRKTRIQDLPDGTEALTLGGDDLAVDAVCFVGEHGNYPANDRGQKLYPRYELMERIVEVFRRTGKVVPVFRDKHFSYSWLKAKQMYDWSRELKFPLMAGSSIPLTVRTPEVEIPYGARVGKRLMLGYGDLDAYGFHTLESMQCMVERRKGGETGIRSVEWLEGPAVWNWRDGAGRWSLPLLEAAFARDPAAKRAGWKTT